MTHSEQTDKLAAALVKVQAAIKPAVKSSANPFFKSKYADLGEVWNACREALTANGIAVVQGGDGDCLQTTLLHTSGQWISGSFRLMAIKPDPQAMGSAITYMRRYSLASMVGVQAEDDDGEAAMARGAGSASTPPATGAATVPLKAERLPIPRAPGSPKAHREQWRGWANDLLAWITVNNPTTAEQAAMEADVGACLDASENMHTWLTDKLAEILDNKRKVA